VPVCDKKIVSREEGDYLVKGSSSKPASSSRLLARFTAPQRSASAGLPANGTQAPRHALELRFEDRRVSALPHSRTAPAIQSVNRARKKEQKKSRT
jgi:hypothetical protein